MLGAACCATVRHMSTKPLTSVRITHSNGRHRFVVNLRSEDTDLIESFGEAERIEHDKPILTTDSATLHEIFDTPKLARLAGLLGKRWEIRELSDGSAEILHGNVVIGTIEMKEMWSYPSKFNGSGWYATERREYVVNGHAVDGVDTNSRNDTLLDRTVLLSEIAAGAVRTEWIPSTEIPRMDVGAGLDQVVVRNPARG